MSSFEDSCESYARGYAGFGMPEFSLAYLMGAAAREAELEEVKSEAAAAAAREVQRIRSETERLIEEERTKAAAAVAKEVQRIRSETECSVEGDAACGIEELDSSPSNEPISSSTNNSTTYGAYHAYHEGKLDEWERGDKSIKFGSDCLLPVRGSRWSGIDRNRYLVWAISKSGSVS